MKIKLFLFVAICCLGSYAAYACGYSECGGGAVQCCKSGGSTYYAKGHGIIDETE
ncbi:hypothetical protein [Pedobacter sp. UBA5917]|jgi:hypothetical protein|uniref:hypothetical protein n=1 Tax=Pedobacter sp. UBA5917 TaxID=1947061 RepID=UPI0025CCD636|nr:hypothetical protein [Pedobacter sp. UBA5917]